MEEDFIGDYSTSVVSEDTHEQPYVVFNLFIVADEYFSKYVLQFSVHTIRQACFFLFPHLLAVVILGLEDLNYSLSLYNA